jgi:hypothetical protein
MTTDVNAKIGDVVTAKSVNQKYQVQGVIIDHPNALGRVPVLANLGDDTPVIHLCERPTQIIPSPVLSPKAQTNLARAKQRFNLG